MRAFLFSIFFAVTTTLLAQQENIAKRIYDSAHNSVFLVYVNDSSGTPQALGSAFLVAPRTLITNAHVIEGGNPVLAVDPIRIPLRVVHIDPINDLALLSVDADLTSKPLVLSSSKVSPGEQIFAIGNPIGLEKTISEGIVSGLRTIGNRNLIQITSPISHGSSGGPILNSNGEVIAVAAAMLEDGENLNFAVPAEYVQLLLSNKTKVEASNPSKDLELAKSLIAKRSQESYSTDQNSTYQRESSQLISLVKDIANRSSNSSTLNEVACFGVNQFDLSDEGITAAEKLVDKNPSPENRTLLAYVLIQREAFEEVNAIFAEKGSEAEKQAQSAQSHYLSEAEHEATEAIRGSKGESLQLADFVLGRVNSDRKEFAKAIQFHSAMITANLDVCGNDSGIKHIGT